MTVVVRRIRPGEGQALRQLRLAALADSPSAFSSTFDAEAALPAAHWDDVAATRSIGDERATFVAAGDGGLVGMAGGYRSPSEPGTVELVSMFTAPGARGTGVGAALVDAVGAWAGETGAARVALWVVRTNGPARRLYERCGFSEVEAPPDAETSPCRDEVRMSRPV